MSFINQLQGINENASKYISRADANDADDKYSKALVEVEDGIDSDSFEFDYTQGPGQADTTKNPFIDDNPFEENPFL